MDDRDNPAAAAFTAARTRFAPSPTGELHLGNARTALFNWLLARRTGGRFLLRIEDTDAARSTEGHARALMSELRWLGLDWDAGPDRTDAKGPYLQSERAALYAAQFAELERRGSVYPCFCTPLELEAARRAQLAAGRPPRYAGTCRGLSFEQQEAKRRQGATATMRFHVIGGRRLEFVDFVHGPQAFLSDDIGDFVVRRADGSAAFFFCNAVDDAHMGVTHVLRGEDHLSNTPRQLLILEALSLAAPSYGHVPLIVGADGAPLSKRHGATSVRDYRERGFLPAALLNHLLRLGHSGDDPGLLSVERMAEGFDPAHLGRAPARFDEQQLIVWQKEAVHHLTVPEALKWLGDRIPAELDAAAREALLVAVLPNVVLPQDVSIWVDVLLGPPPPLEPAQRELIDAAGKQFFAAAADAAAASGDDLRTITEAARAVSGRKGAALYMPLRLALTGLSHGPELAPLLRALPRGKAQERLARFA